APNAIAVQVEEDAPAGEGRFAAIPRSAAVQIAVDDAADFGLFEHTEVEVEASLAAAHEDRIESRSRFAQTKPGGNLHAHVVYTRGEAGEEVRAVGIGGCGRFAGIQYAVGVGVQEQQRARSRRVARVPLTVGVHVV